MYKTKYDGEPKSFTVLSKTVGRPINWKNYQLSPAYSEAIPLKPKLHADLMWYVQKGHIPTAYHCFYNALPKPAVVPRQTKGKKKTPQLTKKSAKSKKSGQKHLR